MQSIAPKRNATDCIQQKEKENDHLPPPSSSASATPFFSVENKGDAAGIPDRVYGHKIRNKFLLLCPHQRRYPPPHPLPKSGNGKSFRLKKGIPFDPASGIRVEAFSFSPYRVKDLGSRGRLTWHRKLRARRKRLFLGTRIRVARARRKRTGSPRICLRGSGRYFGIHRRSRDLFRASSGSEKRGSQGRSSSWL